jgi:hypothetical protein
MQATLVLLLSLVAMPDLPGWSPPTPPFASGAACRPRWVDAGMPRPRRASTHVCRSSSRQERLE